MGNPLNFADEINYSGNAVTLVLTAFGFAPFAGTHNQEEVARVLDGMPGDHALVRAVCSTAVRGQAQRWLVHSAHGWLGWRRASSWRASKWATGAARCFRKGTRWACTGSTKRYEGSLLRGEVGLRVRFARMTTEDMGWTLQYEGESRRESLNDLVHGSVQSRFQAERLQGKKCPNVCV